MASAVAEIPVTERYRAVILSVLGVGSAGLVALSGALVEGRPLGGVELVSVAVAILTSVGVYFPGNPWAKFVAALVGTVGQTLVSAWTDGVITPGEISTIALMLASAVGVGAFPNAPALVVGEPGADVPDREPVTRDGGYGLIEYAIGVVVLLIVIVLLFRVLG